MSEDRGALIRERLTGHLNPERVEVEDDSHRHRGHAGAAAGGGHFNVLVVSSVFTGCNRLQRHRLVYEAMGDAMRADTIHALSIRALTPEEYNG